jgi:tetratricopeptide (TPR) repeat protein
VQVAPETQIVTTPGTASATAPAVNTSGSTYIASGVTPLPGGPGDPSAKLKPVKIIAPAPVNFPRYTYLSPRRPAAGDRRAASGAFTQARMAEQNEKWADTLKAYREAAELDPAWFEAHYNAGVVAQRLRNFASALASYEMALAIQPDSVDARYNFALTLKAAGYAPDGANEFKKILAAHPNEIRAHLALANLCAQSLRDPGQAREHYLKVLELDPKNPQTTDIQHWLATNPG